MKKLKNYINEALNCSLRNEHINEKLVINKDFKPIQKNILKRLKIKVLNALLYAADDDYFMNHLYGSAEYIVNWLTSNSVKKVEITISKETYLKINNDYDDIHKSNYHIINNESFEKQLEELKNSLHNDYNDNSEEIYTNSDTLVFIDYNAFKDFPLIFIVKVI